MENLIEANFQIKAENQEDLDNQVQQQLAEYEKEMEEKYGEDWEDNPFIDDIPLTNPYSVSPLEETIANHIINSIACNAHWSNIRYHTENPYIYWDSKGKKKTIKHARIGYCEMPLEYTENGSPIEEDNLYPERIIINLDKLKKESLVEVTLIDNNNVQITSYVDLSDYLKYT